jgi:hypothetical protein
MEWWRGRPYIIPASLSASFQADPLSKAELGTSTRERFIERPDLYGFFDFSIKRNMTNSGQSRYLFSCRPLFDRKCELHNSGNALYWLPYYHYAFAILLGPKNSYTIAFNLSILCFVAPPLLTFLKENPAGFKAYPFLKGERALTSL